MRTHAATRMCAHARMNPHAHYLARESAGFLRSAVQPRDKRVLPFDGLDVGDRRGDLRRRGRRLERAVPQRCTPATLGRVVRDARERRGEVGGDRFIPIR